MKSLIMIFILLITSINYVHASDFEYIDHNDICLTDFTTLGEYGSQKSFGYEKSLSCKDREVISKLGNIGSFYFGKLSIACSFIPEPGISKITAAVLGITGLTLGFMSAMISTSDCNSSGERPPTPTELENFKYQVCQSMIANGMENLPEDCR